LPDCFSIFSGGCNQSQILPRSGAKVIFFHERKKEFFGFFYPVFFRNEVEYPKNRCFRAISLFPKISKKILSVNFVAESKE